jgi:hypothetical protein
MLQFEKVDNTILRQWQISDKNAPFFSPHNIECTVKSLPQCLSRTDCKCVLMKDSDWNEITKTQQKLREFFLYLPVSVLKNSDNSWKNNGELLCSCSVDNHYYELFLISSPINYEQQVKQLQRVENTTEKIMTVKSNKYDNLLFDYNKKLKEHVSNNKNRKVLLFFLLHSLKPFYNRCNFFKINSRMIFFLINICLKFRKEK